MQRTVNNLSSLKHSQQWLVMAMVFVLYALGGHALLHPLAPDLDIDAALAIRAGGEPLRLLGYGVLAAIAFRGLRALRLKSILAPSRLGLCVIFTLSWMALSILWSQVTFVSVKALVGMLVLWVSCVGISRELSLKDIRAAGSVYAAGVTVLGVVCEVALSTWHPFTAGYRFSGTTDPNAQGLTCALLLVTLLNCAPHAGWLRGLRYGTLIAAFLLLLLTQSRGAVIAYSGSIVVIVAARLTPRAKFALIGITCLLFAVTIGALMIDYSQLSNLAATATLGRDTVAADGFGGARQLLWRECLAALSTRPLLGYGYGVFWGEERIRDIADAIGWAPTHAHSGYIETALNTGLVGLTALFITLLGAITYHIRDYRVTHRLEARYAAALLVLLITNMLFETVTSTTFATHILALCVIMRGAFATAAAQRANTPAYCTITVVEDLH